MVPVISFIPPALAQSSNPNPASQQAPAGQDTAKEAQKIDEYAEAQHAINGPAGNPECVWLGRRVVSLLWRDDLDTAFRHLDLYDRFGCPERPYSGCVPLPCPALQHHRSQDPRQLERPGTGLLDQSVARSCAGTRGSGAFGRGAGADHDAITFVVRSKHYFFCSEVLLLALCCLEFAIA